MTQMLAVFHYQYLVIDVAQIMSIFENFAFKESDYSKHYKHTNLFLLILLHLSMMKLIKPFIT